MPKKLVRNSSLHKFCVVHKKIIAKKSNERLAKAWWLDGDYGIAAMKKHEELEKVARAAVDQYSTARREVTKAAAVRLRAYSFSFFFAWMNASLILFSLCDFRSLLLRLRRLRLFRLRILLGARP